MENGFKVWFVVVFGFINDEDCKLVYKVFEYEWSMGYYIF